MKYAPTFIYPNAKKKISIRPLITALALSSAFLLQGCITDKISNKISDALKPAPEQFEVESGTVTMTFTHGDNVNIPSNNGSSSGSFPAYGQLAMATFFDTSSALIHRFYPYDNDYIKMHVRYEGADEMMQIVTSSLKPNIDALDNSKGFHDFSDIAITAGDTLYFDLYIDNNGPYTSFVKIPPVAMITGLTELQEVGVTDNLSVIWGEQVNDHPINASISVLACVSDPSAEVDTFGNFEKLPFSETGILSETYDNVNGVHIVIDDLLTFLQESTEEGAPGFALAELVSEGIPTGTLCQAEAHTQRIVTGTLSNDLQDSSIVSWKRSRISADSHYSVTFYFRF